jgi:CRISPR system Cascade subunit CasA
LGLAPAGGPGARVVRDVRRLLALRNRVLDDYPFYPRSGGLGLVWLVPWDGRVPLSPSALDPLYVEICRRVRLCARPGGGLTALVTGSAAARVDAKALSGRTGDPWTPLMADGDARKALTVDASGFSYKRLVPLLFPPATDPKAPVRAPLQLLADDDAPAGLRIVARAVVRGQGKTEGYHEREVPVSQTLRRFLGAAQATDEAAAVAAARVSDASTFARRVLYPAVLTVYTAAPSARERARDDDTAKRRAGAALTTFDGAVDTRFFADLDEELANAGDAEAQREVRRRWLLALRDLGRGILNDVLRAAPTAAMRHYRTSARAQRRFDAAFRHHFGDRTAQPSASPAPVTPA